MTTSLSAARKPQVRLWLGLVAIFVIGWIFYWDHLNPWLWERRQRGESIELLAKISDVKTLEQTVGKYGLVLVLPNGDWVAIRHAHRHQTPFDALSIAKDSEGRWYEDRKWYCGDLKGYALNSFIAITDKELAANAPTDANLARAAESERKLLDNPLYRRLHTMTTSSNLASARPHLLELGFREFAPAQAVSK